MAKRVGVLLSGSGVYDGAEIHESVITMLALDRRGAEMVFCAPDAPQMHVVNHLTGEVEEGAERNILVESARIARGNIQDVASVSADDVDALILSCPLCDYNLGRSQRELAGQDDSPGELPLVYFTQLLAMAFGLDAGVTDGDA